MITKELLKRISMEPHTLHGRPRIRGTRIAVTMILELLAAGYNPQEICSEKFYPDISTKDVLACIAFAAQFLNEEEIHFFEELTHKS